MKEKIKKTLKIIFLFAVIATIAMYWYDQYGYYFGGYSENSACSEYSNVAVINIHGDIAAYLKVPSSAEEPGSVIPDSVSSEKIVNYVDQIEDSSNIEAVIVEIESYGGSPVASEEIADALRRMTKPVVAVIRGIAASGAYLIASAADKVYASEMSEVGSIGVTMSYLDYSQQNRQEGIAYQQLSSGKFKDTGDPDKILTAEEKELIMRDIKILHEAFVKKVAENRGLDIEQVEKLADGSTMLGVAAKENELIDEIGNIYDAQEWIRGELGIEPEICVY